MQFCKTRQQTIVIYFLLMLTGCSSPQKKEFPVIITPQPYSESFYILKKYIQKCLPSANLRAHLYTELHEAEIVLDQLPAATLYFIGGIASSSHEPAQEILNIKLHKESKKTKITTKNEASYNMANAAFSDKPCPFAEQ